MASLDWNYCEECNDVRKTTVYRSKANDYDLRKVIGSFGGIQVEVFNAEGVRITDKVTSYLSEWWGASY
jgi:hypothetical protein